MTALAENSTCGANSVSSTEESDIDCLCHFFFEADPNEVREPAEALFQCIQGSCNQEDYQSLDPNQFIAQAEGLCGTDFNQNGEIEGDSMFYLF